MATATEKKTREVVRFTLDDGSTVNRDRNKRIEGVAAFDLTDHSLTFYGVGDYLASGQDSTITLKKIVGIELIEAEPTETGA